MKVQQFPKPQHKKPRTKKYGPLFPLGYCLGCLKEYGLERHHLYGGNPDRKLSEQYGLYCDLCQKCHLSVTDEKDRELSARLKQEGQRRFEAVYSRELFYQIFKRNYL
ncbi:MAG: hypothetical protein PHQ35_09605 [Phycisphaerae bacterium]|nr:hypothetical protein [Phycisphaerae bacterium]MDD5239971.1 hypothetical protein [Candidatus Nanoarchaeia archaeon]